MTRINILRHYPFNEDYYKLFVGPLLREAIDREIVRLEHRLENSKYEIEFDLERALPQPCECENAMSMPIKLPHVDIYFSKSDFSKASLKILDHFTQDIIGSMWESTPSRALKFDLVYLSKDKGNYFLSHSVLDGILEIEDKLIFSFVPGYILQNELVSKMRNKQH